MSSYFSSYCCWGSRCQTTFHVSDHRRTPPRTLGSLFASSCNKWPQTRWLKKIDYTLLDLEAQKAKSGCQQGNAPTPRTLGRALPWVFVAFTGWPPTLLFLRSQTDHSNLCFLSVCLCVQMPLFLLKEQSDSICAHPNGLILTQLHLQRPYFQITSHSQFHRLRLRYIFLEVIR